VWQRVAPGADNQARIVGVSGGPLNAAELQHAVDVARQKHNVPGISAAFCSGDQVILATSGVTNIATGVEMTTDTIMHIGSITKVITATLVLQLVDQGKLTLERPVIYYMPSFRVGDPEATRTITVGELLNHTSGIDANLLPDVGHDQETIQNTVARMRTAPQLHPPAQGRSYCNAGFVIAGYLCQKITGTSWYDLVKQKVYGPLGLEDAVVLPEDAVLYRASVGHYLNPATNVAIRTPLAFLPLGYSPAGSTAMMSANDLMTFGRAHMADGVGPNGKRILSAESAARMRVAFGSVSGPQAFDCAIAWQRSVETDGLLYKGGGGPGIVSLLVTHPESKTAIVVLTNADYGVGAAADVIQPFIKTQLGIDTFPAPPKPLADSTVDPTPYIGIFENSSLVHEIASTNGHLTWLVYDRASYDSGSRSAYLPVQTLLPAGEGRFVAGTSVLRFLDPDASGRMRYLALDLWLYRRTERARTAAS